MLFYIVLVIFLSIPLIYTLLIHDVAMFLTKYGLKRNEIWLFDVRYKNDVEEDNQEFIKNYIRENDFLFNYYYNKFIDCGFPRNIINGVIKNSDIVLVKENMYGINNENSARGEAKSFKLFRRIFMKKNKNKRLIILSIGAIERGEFKQETFINLIFHELLHHVFHEDCGSYWGVGHNDHTHELWKKIGV